jgi:hypothetical protein
LTGGNDDGVSLASSCVSFTQVRSIALNTTGSRITIFGARMAARLRHASCLIGFTLGPLAGLRDWLRRPSWQVLQPQGEIPWFR